MVNEIRARYLPKITVEKIDEAQARGIPLKEELKKLLHFFEDSTESVSGPPIIKQFDQESPRALRVYLKIVEEKEKRG
ncbi:MAG: hypothetical protein L0J44_11965 [Tetragenococcus koreensis]|nr:hypothetical protein [Tetragenococcus koreensis]